MKDSYFEPMMAVWDNLAMAQVFIHIAKQGGAPYIELRWLINCAAGGLWAAVDIFNAKVADGDERLGARRKPSQWFEEYELLVNQLRHGQVHFKQEHGVGHAVEHQPGEDPKLVVFVWVGSDFDGNYDEIIPIDEALSRLDAVRVRIEEHASALTGQDQSRIYLPEARLVEANEHGDGEEDAPIDASY